MAPQELSGVRVAKGPEHRDKMNMVGEKVQDQTDRCNDVRTCEIHTPWTVDGSRRRVEGHYHTN